MGNKIAIIFITFIIPHLVLAGDVKENANPYTEKSTSDSPSSYMYIYCKRSPNNPYCGNTYSKHLYIHYLLRNKNSDSYSPSQSTLRSTTGFKGGSTSLDSENESLRPSNKQPTGLKVNDSSSQTLDNQPGQINSRSYLANWIKESFGVELNRENYTAAELAEIYTRLIWCSKIEEEIKRPCDYSNKSSEELQKTYESLKGKAN